MLTNTQKRIISALILILIVGFCLFQGTAAVLILLGVIGVISIDEMFCNFLGKKRVSIQYLFGQLLFVIPFLYFNFIEKEFKLLEVFVNAGVVFNLFLVIYLFYIPMSSGFVKKLTDKFPYISSLLILLPMMSLFSVLHYENWLVLLVILMLVNFGMDSGAWFFGKNFGKNKLWPSVSPNKTIEGLVGGALTAALLGSLSWHFLQGDFKPYYFVIFLLFGILAQVGDLIQSKLKRNFDIKDSSNLIPGHGGVYDRIDSLLFIAPLYATLLKNIYFN